MTPQAFRKLALSFEEAVEAPHFERASFRVGNRIFATLVPDGSEAMVRLTPERANTLIAAHPKLYFSYGGWTETMGALGVRLPSVDEKTLKPLVGEAWSALLAKTRPAGAPKRLRPPAPRGKKTATRRKRG